jgi:hypothetical protein
MISDKQIKFSSNLQDEIAEMSHIQSIQVEEIIQVADDHSQQLVFFIFSHRPLVVLGPYYALNQRLVIVLTTSHVEIVEISDRRRSSIQKVEFSSTEHCISKFVVWVNMSHSNIGLLRLSVSLK